MIYFSLVFAAGFLGSAHCVGMCGGFVLAASAAVGLAGVTVGSAFASVQNMVSIGGGALTMLVFGGATVPALFALAWIGDLLQLAWQHRLHRANGVLVIVLGLITVLRGTPAMHLLMS